MESNGRQYHELVAFQHDALRLLRDGSAISDVMWKERHPGSRIAPVVDKLRNAHGFSIDGSGTVREPYYMTDLLQYPTRVAVTDAMKEAYYETGHWMALRDSRRAMDGRCLLCGADDELQVHHICYELFREHIDDLMTVCKYHHEKIHAHSRLKFPSGITVADALRLGFNVQFDEWLVPSADLADMF